MQVNNGPSMYKTTIYKLLPDDKVAVYVSLFFWEVHETHSVNRTISNEQFIINKNELDPGIVSECKLRGYYETTLLVDSNVPQKNGI